MKRFLLIAFTLALAACRGDSSGVDTTSLTGTWRFAWNVAGRYSGAWYTCRISYADFQLTQSGNTFSGVQAAPFFRTCGPPGSMVASPASRETITGEIDGSTVTFILHSGEAQTGTLSGTSISGNAEWSWPSMEGTVTLTGTFTAAKL